MPAVLANGESMMRTGDIISGFLSSKIDRLPSGSAAFDGMD